MSFPFVQTPNILHKTFARYEQNCPLPSPQIKTSRYYPSSLHAGAGGEIQLTDAMASLIGNQPFHGFTFDGQRYDCGDKAGYIQANLAISISRGDIGQAVRDFAITLLRTH